MGERVQAQGAPDLPTGTVTFLLTDIVGSTTLWDEAPAAMRDAMERHDGLVDDAVAVHRGQVIRPRGEGDSRFAVFTRASDAVSTAVDLQVALLAVDWPTPEPLRVRTAIHTGEADPRADDYYGTSVNRCARLRGLAAPGQVLVSEVTASLVRVERLPSVTFRDLGTHHLRGLAAPERVFQLCHPDLPDDFPPPASEDEGLELPAGRQVPLALPLQPPDGIPFVGRADELGRLWRSWHLVQEGRAQVVLVNGEPGMGKTRLAAEFAVRVHDEGATVLVGRCDREALRSYQPFAEALGSYLRWWSASGPPATASHLPAELAWLVPELAPRLPAPPTSLLDDPETDRVRLFEAVVSVLGELGRESPVLLVLDDLHWADHSTVLLLRHLLRRSDAAPLMVLGTSRSGDEGRDLSDAIADFGREERVRRVSLGGLGETEVGALLRASVPRGVLTGTPGEVQDLRDVTGGNPFFIKHVVHQLAEQDPGPAPVALRAVAPEGVRDLVAQRLAGLSSQAAALLPLAAVIGQEFDLGLLARTSDHSEDEALDLLEEAAAAFLVEEHQEVVDRFLFSHALVRNVIYRTLSASRRARLHRHVGELLEASAPPGGPAVRELAHHFLEAAPTGGTDKAVRYAMAAADSAMASLAFEDAAELCSRALDLLARQSSPDGDLPPAIEIDLIMCRGLAERRAGRSTGRTALLHAFDLAMGIGDLSRAAAAVLALNRGFFARIGRPDRALVKALEQVIAAQPPGDSPVQADLLATLASELVWAPDGERRFALSDQALAMARRIGDRGALARALLLRNMTISAPDTLDERAAECAELLELAEDLEDPVLRFHAAFQRSGTAVEAGDIDGADAMVDVASRLAEHLRQPDLLWQAGFMETSQLIMAGALEDAEQRALDTFERGRCAQQEGEAMIFFTEQMLEIRRWQGRLPEMVESIRGLAGVDGMDFGYSLVRYLFDAGEEDAALARYREVVERVRLPVRRDLLAATTLVNLAYLAAKVGDAERIDGIRDLLTPFADVFASTTVAKPVGAHFLGMLAAASGDVPGAEALFRSAVAAHDRARAPLFLAETRLEWATLLARVGGRRADVDHLVDAARRVAEVHGAGLLQRRTAALLDAIGR